MITIETVRVMKQGVKQYQVVSILAPEWDECPKTYLDQKDVALFGAVINRRRPELKYYTLSGDDRILLYVGQIIPADIMCKDLIPRIKAAVDLLRKETAAAAAAEKDWCGVYVTFRF
jgi:hypothetical protein